PDILRNYRYASAVVIHHIRDIAACQCRNDLLPDRREWNNADVDRVPARLLILSDDIAEGGVLLGNETLGPPYACGLGRCVGDEGSCKSSSGCQTDRPAEHRTPAKPAHAVPPWFPLVLRSDSRPWGELIENVWRLSPHASIANIPAAGEGIAIWQGERPYR